MEKLFVVNSLPRMMKVRFVQTALRLLLLELSIVFLAGVKMTKSQPGKPIKIPHHIYTACEAEAVRRRKKTGKLIYWTAVLFEAVEKSLSLNSNSRS